MRRGGSNIAALVTVGLLTTASVPLFMGKVSKEALKENSGWIGGGSAIIFAVVLLWWWWSDEDESLRQTDVDKKGIGNETIIMVVTVITALIAIVALLNP